MGEILRRVISKAILQVAKPDIEEACGFEQKCSGMPVGIEAAVHAMQEIYMEESTEGILLVDATNAFNSLNRSAALHNVKFTCPVLATFLHNAYQNPARLFINGGGEITSEEGTTQGDPLSMAFYALSTVPLISTLQTDHPDVRQIWYATMIHSGTLCIQRKVTKFPCFGGLVFRAQFQHFLSAFWRSFFSCAVSSCVYEYNHPYLVSERLFLAENKALPYLRRALAHPRRALAIL